MKRLGGKGVFLIAVVLGGLTSYLMWRYVDEVGRAAKPVETAPVVVAAAAIPARTLITAEMVRVQQIPVEARHPAAARAANDVVGKVSRSDLTAGEPVLNTRLFLDREESGLAFLVPPDKRAVSVGFTEVIGSGGLIQPSDRVDVIGVFEVKAGDQISGTVERRDNESTYVSTMVLQNVEVLAVAQRIEGQDTRNAAQRTAQESGLFGRGGNTQAPRVEAQPAPQAKTATLSVTPAEALRLVLAEERGKIRLALRPANDTATAELQGLPIGAIVRTGTRQ